MPLYIGDRAPRPGRIEVIAATPSAGPYETVERKGRGHPDSIADALAERVSRMYARYTCEHCDGLILHHQMDKLMVIGGREDVTWGAGELVEPVEVIVAGRASRSYRGYEIPVREIVEHAVRSYFAETFPMLDAQRDIVVTDRLTTHAGPGTLRESTGAIAHMFDPVRPSAVRGYEKSVANDTSYCCAHAPLSPLERAVISAEEMLTAPTASAEYPWLGTDIKVMASRRPSGEVHVTMCIPQIAAHVPSFAIYQENLDRIGHRILDHFSVFFPRDSVHLSLNTKDDPRTKNVYLTSTGASLCGDIGAVGRGNRLGGLITSRRPMSLEGFAGKNPVYYSGFVYSHLAKLMAERIASQSDAPCEVEVVSQNGGPLAEPWLVTVLSPHDEKRVRAWVEEELCRIPQITDDFVADRL